MKPPLRNPGKQNSKRPSASMTEKKRKKSQPQQGQPRGRRKPTKNQNQKESENSKPKPVFGPQQKKDDVANILRENELRVLCMQEIGIEPTANPNSLSIKDYKLELENNSIKKVQL